MYLAYDDAGSGGPAVVLVHGWGFGHPSHLLPQFEYLASRRRVLKLDLPGHGRSDRPPRSFGFRDCAAAIVARLDTAEIDRAVLCGHSLGGRLAVEVAAAYPSRIAAVALLDPVILFPEVVREQALTELVPALASETWLKALEAYFSRLFEPVRPAGFEAPRVEGAGPGFTGVGRLDHADWHGNRWFRFSCTATMPAAGGERPRPCGHRTPATAAAGGAGRQRCWLGALADVDRT